MVVFKVFHHYCKRAPGTEYLPVLLGALSCDVAFLVTVVASLVVTPIFKLEISDKIAVTYWGAGRPLRSGSKFFDCLLQAIK